MKEHEVEAAQRLVSNKKWEWRSGMKAVFYQKEESECTFLRVSDWDADKIKEGVRPIWFENHIPDLSDDATRGAVLGLIRDCIGKPIWVRDLTPQGGDWDVCCRGSAYSVVVVASGTSEGAALARALEKS
jgi:hypothetical protein